MPNINTNSQINGDDPLSSEMKPKNTPPIELDDLMKNPIKSSVPEAGEKKDTEQFPSPASTHQKTELSDPASDILKISGNSERVPSSSKGNEPAAESDNQKGKEEIDIHSILPKASESPASKFSMKAVLSKSVEKLLRLLPGKKPSQNNPGMAGKGNVFTKMFDNEKKESSHQQTEEGLIDTIILQSDAGQGKTSPEAKRKHILEWQNPKEAKRMLDIQEQNKKQAENRFQIAKICLGSSLLVPLVSFLLSSVFLSTDGILSRVIAHKNYGLILQKKQQDFSQLETDIKARNKEQETFKQKISEIRDNKVLSGIIDRRIHWNEVFGAIENLTNKTFEGNKVSRYVTFKNYSGKSDKNQISIQGEVRNAEGKSWKDLIKLKDALNAHENFEGVIINQFVKQLASPDSRSSSSEYISPFSFQFHYLKDGKNSDSDAVVLNE